ncbi:response regulator transcription factor [Sedimentibacter hydroxybenzoicus]|uniref:response regulator transcription factor n=1 Tax=Sedimentibacter hydroxybenzoicus TaxID=29345 RepID=UPI001C52D514|nr:LuxR C-terminal-related transcriptional regulator [Sedimentibacter hydroxybenzoicus]
MGCLYTQVLIRYVISYNNCYTIIVAYIKPIHNAINIIKQNPSTGTKTNIPEFDDLIECISTKEETDPDSLILNEFLSNLRTLSPSERAVFNLYAENNTAKEIAEKLFLSINTIKTHTKHIYAKLNIKSKDELLLYVEMLKESGKKII